MSITKKPGSVTLSYAAHYSDGLKELPSDVLKRFESLRLWFEEERRRNFEDRSALARDLEDLAARLKVLESKA